MGLDHRMKATCTPVPEMGDLFDHNDMALVTSKGAGRSLAATSCSKPDAAAPPSNISRPVGLSVAADERYLSDIKVAERYCVSRPTVWRWAKHREDFPAPLKVSEGISRWRLSDLIAFDSGIQESGEQ